MEWMSIIGNSLSYIEDHLCDEITVDEIAENAHISSYYFQKGFAMLCGYTVSEYIRNRRLALAGRDVLMTDEKIIDIAVKYGYDSADSFTKAFSRFHSVTPSAARKGAVLLKTFAPLKIKITLEGGKIMEYKIVKKEAFTVMGNAQTFAYENAKEECPKFWQEHFASGKGAVVCGTYGINIDADMGMSTFEYLIADPYNTQREVPEGFTIRTIPAFDWAVFPCHGPMPEALQNVNTEIFTEWLPGLKEYEFAAGYCVEYYDDPSKYEKGTADENYYCEIWIPVNKK